MKTLQYSSVDPAEIEKDEPSFGLEVLDSNGRVIAWTTDGVSEGQSAECLALHEHLKRNDERRRLAREHKKKQARPKKKTKKSKPSRRAKSTPATKWLRQLICPLVFGEKTPEGVRPSLTKEQFQQRWNLGWGLPSVSNYRLLDHFAGKETLYFFGQGRRRAPNMLVVIDIDVQKSKGLGSAKGAKAFADHLKRIWPDLYFEPSTNGKGIHCYFVLAKWRCTASDVNAALKRFEKWLRAEASKSKADIEVVEVKGTCMALQFADRKIESVKYGMFAKLPRDVSRFSEWERTTVIRAEDLMSRRFDVVEEPETAKNDFPSSTIVSVKKKSASGSVSGRIISMDELASIPAYERLYREWVGPVDLKARKFSVAPHDFAVAMVILRHYKADPNADGSLPCRRVEKLWAALFDAGDVDRPWNHHRWKAIRDFLSERGHIDWRDHRYEYGAVAQDGTIKRGIACKWTISDEFDSTLEKISTLPDSEGGASFVDTAIRQLIRTQGNGENLRPQPFLLRMEIEKQFWWRAYEACEHLFAA